jgi:carbamoyl-phosphate synthase large subunit
MPKRKDIKKILIIGAGPIVIGQACEFDYSGAQACKALKEENFKVVLVNSNPATIMTDPNLADRTYIEPLDVETISKIIEREKPDALLSTMGGQTALNLSIELERRKILKKFNVKLIGASQKVINKAEDRDLFKKAMKKIDIETPKGFIVNNLKESERALKNLDFPIIVRPSFTLGGAGGGTANSIKEYQKIVKKGLSLSPINEVLVEESLIGWKEYEMEVIRDKKDNCIIVCSIENIDPMGVHTGDSITVAPSLTLTDKEYQRMRNYSIDVIREIGVETGGANVQFAVNPKTGRMVVIEMNPRVSRSSALALLDIFET